MILVSRGIMHHDRNHGVLAPFLPDQHDQQCMINSWCMIEM